MFRLVLAPFVAGDKSVPSRVRPDLRIHTRHLAGRFAIGFALGSLSATLPPQARYITDTLTAAIIIVLGAILIFRPHLLHSHDHEHDHTDHDHEHHHREHGCDCHVHGDKMNGLQ
ncbi:hypothetical protein [Pseudodesulfovibrio tunisiensis]|uniref:hypothetical protein n=1 Tax=Pseudodesulfovibrio tunisiensis TaxID=463192 RepID=UPI001FB47A52|nr:hypothetical protein [Pseudodesulfovibrio tunisiensis]